MHLGTPESAILSAIIFNALIILALVPLALTGSSTARSARRPASAQPADLRSRRDDPSVRRDQADRPGRAQPPRSLIAGPLPDPARHGRRSRQDLPHAPGGPPGPARGPRRRRSATSSPTTGRDRGCSPTGSSRCRTCAAPRRARARRDGRRRGDRPRSPELALVDELAHTNVPEARNRKRYEDIDEMLDAADRRHLDRQRPAPREPQRLDLRADGRPRPRDVPGPVLDEADEVVLVDLTPEALQERLLAGKVYPADRVETALQQLLPRRQPRGAPRARAARARRRRRGNGAT